MTIDREVFKALRYQSIPGGAFIRTGQINQAVVGGYEIALEYPGKRCRQLEARVKELEK